MSLPFKLDKADGIHIAKVAGYSIAATIIGALIVIVGKLQVNPEYLFLVPLANTLLVSAEQFFLDKSKE